MNASPDERIRRALADLREASALTGPTIEHISMPVAGNGHRSWFAVAAATVLIASGAAGVIVVRSTTSDAPGAGPAAAPPVATSSADPAIVASGFLAPSPLPDGYVLYTDEQFDGSYTNPAATQLTVEVILGPAEATPDDIVEIVAGATTGEIPCGSMDTGEGLDPPGLTVGEAVATFCDDPYAARQLAWTADGTPVMLLAGSAVTDDQLLTIARGVVVPSDVGMDRQVFAEDIAVTGLPAGWMRFGGDEPPLVATEYEIGSATERFAPTYRVSIYANTAHTDIWAIMNGRFTSTPVTVRGTTGYLDESDSDGANPFLVWQEADGLIVHIQSSGGSRDSILAFAETLEHLPAAEQEEFLQTAQPRPAQDDTTSPGAGPTTT